MPAEPVVLFNPPAGRLGSRHAILRGRGRRHHVSEFAGPLSIKWVARGFGVWEAGGGRFRVEGDRFLVLNEGQTYSLAIDSAQQPVETFCVFFRRGFLEEALESVTVHAEKLLDDPFASRGCFQLPQTLHTGDAGILPRLARMRRTLERGGVEPTWLEGEFQELAAGLLALRDSIEREVARVPAVRAATRAELHRRLLRGRDHLESAFSQRVTLEQVAREACLSPHHFHRLFRRHFGETPHGYLTRRRLERARELLRVGAGPIWKIAADCGFESPGAFSTLFKRRFGASPRWLRKSKIEEESAAAAG